MVLSAGLYASGWPDQIRAHPYVVLALFALGALILVLGFVWPKGTKAGEPQPQSPSSIHAPINVQVNPVFNNSPTVTQTASIPNDRKEQAFQAREVRLIVDKPSFHFLHRTHTVWQMALPGTVEYVLGAVAWIQNEVPEEGKAGKAIDSAIASLTYRGENGTLATVATAYWLDEFAHKIGIKIGQRRGILLGTLPGGLAGPLWLTMENPSERPFRPRLDAAVLVPSPKVLELTFMRIREIQVSIIEKEITLKRFSVFVENKGQDKWNLELQRPT